MTAYGLVLLFLLLMCLIGALVLFRKKWVPRQKKLSPARVAAGKLQEPIQKTSPLKPASPEMEPWWQRIEKAHYVPLKEGFTPTSFDRMDEKRKELVEERLAGLLPLPTFTLKLTNLLRNPQSNAKEISAIASKDPILTARILRAVNSAYFGLPHEVTSVGQAIVLLGYNQVKALLFDDIIQKNLSRLKMGDKERADRIWTHSIVVSVCANEVGRLLAKDQEIDWGTLGLLHDIGKYFLYSLKKMSEPDPELPSLLREEQQFGVNHAILGGLVAESWKLPKEIGQTIVFHHHSAFFPIEAIPPHLRLSSSIIYLADHIAKIFGFSDGNDEIYPLRKDFLQNLRLSPDLKNLVSPAFVHAIERAISINEEEGFFPGIKEVKGKQMDFEKRDGALERDDFLKMECPKCEYEAAVSPQLLSFGEKFMWVCPNCTTRVIRRFSQGPKDRED